MFWVKSINYTSEYGTLHHFIFSMKTYLNYCTTFYVQSQDSSVSIVPRLQAGPPKRSGSKFLTGQETFLFSIMSRPPLGPTQPPSNGYPWWRGRGMKLISHLHLVSRRMVELCLHSLCLHNMVYNLWSSEDNFNFILHLLCMFMYILNFNKKIQLQTHGGLAFPLV
jgi:hypothetical protein